MSDIKRIALVTGGLSGIGRAIASRLTRESMIVVIADISDSSRDDGMLGPDVAKSIGDECTYVRADVSDVDDVERLFGVIKDTLGALDVLVNNAGIVSFAPLADLSVLEFDRVMRVNVRGAFLCSREAIAIMRSEARPGVIVNVASNFGLVGAKDAVAYCASKAAVISMTRALAIEVGPDGIRVNALCPGATATEFNREHRSRPDVATEWARMTPLRQDGDRYLAVPAEISEAAAFLAGDASKFMTGASLVVDGGWTAA